MKRIAKWEDLAPYGIDMLTGESCAYGYRLLCDVNSRGMELLASVFGLHDFARRKRAAHNQLYRLADHVGELDANSASYQSTWSHVSSFIDYVQPMQLPDSWNGRDNADWSIMLPPEMFTPLAIFALFSDGCERVYTMHGSGEVNGIEPTDKPEDVETWLKWNQGHYCEECRRYGAGGGVKFTYRNPGFSRNQHQMSGRTE